MELKQKEAEMKKLTAVHQPGIEPGSVPWQGTILPLDHWCSFWSVCRIVLFIHRKDKSGKEKRKETKLKKEMYSYAGFAIPWCYRRVRELSCFCWFWGSILQSKLRLNAFKIWHFAIPVFQVAKDGGIDMWTWMDFKCPIDGQKLKGKW